MRVLLNSFIIQERMKFHRTVIFLLLCSVLLSGCAYRDTLYYHNVFHVNPVKGNPRYLTGKTGVVLNEQWRNTENRYLNEKNGTVVTDADAIIDLDVNIYFIIRIKESTRLSIKDLILSYNKKHIFFTFKLHQGNCVISSKGLRSSRIIAELPIGKIKLDSFSGVISYNNGSMYIIVGEGSADFLDRSGRYTMTAKSGEVLVSDTSGIVTIRHKITNLEYIILDETLIIRRLAQKKGNIEYSSLLFSKSQNLNLYDKNIPVSGYPELFYYRGRVNQYHSKNMQHALRDYHTAMYLNTEPYASESCIAIYTILKNTGLERKAMSYLEYCLYRFTHSEAAGYAANTLADTYQ